jgi:hypothetical protein
MVGRPNAAHAGFEGSVAAKLALGGKTGLDRHVEAVVNGLRNGKRLEQALLYANQYWPPQGFPLQDPPAPMPMAFRGDGWARLVNVYVSEQEDAELGVWEQPKEAWYWFKP